MPVRYGVLSIVFNLGDGAPQSISQSDEAFLYCVFLTFTLTPDCIPSTYTP